MDKMNQKPNFKTMTSQELKSYVLSHREDDEAFYAYVDKVNERKDRVVYPPLNSLEDLEKYPEVIEQMRQDSRHNFQQNELTQIQCDRTLSQSGQAIAQPKTEGG
jgi:aromatic ring hydroxylase